MALPSGFGGGGDWGGAGRGDKSLALPLTETLRLAWADPDLRQRIVFVLAMFAVFAFGVHVPVPIAGLRSADVISQIANVPGLEFLNVFGGGALKRLSIFTLGLNPYITSSIIMQILQAALPKLKQEMQEGGEYARKQQNRRTRILTLFLCVFQGWGFLTVLSGVPQIAQLAVGLKIITVLFWTAGAMFMLWIGEQISERGIGNGISLMIFAGIVLSLPTQVQTLVKGYKDGVVAIWSIIVVLLIFLVATWAIVYFTTAQRRIPIQHMRRMVGTKMMGGQTSYLPLSVNMAGVLPIIFAVSLLGLPYQFSTMAGGATTQLGSTLAKIADFFNPMSGNPLYALVGALAFTGMIFFFTYFWTAIQYNVEDISNNLKRGGSFIPGVRPGKQTKDFLDGVISRITLVGAAFIAAVALIQYIAPRVAALPPNSISAIGGTSLLILVSVALETMRQIEANLLMKQYGQ